MSLLNRADELRKERQESPTDLDIAKERLREFTIAHANLCESLKTIGMSVEIVDTHRLRDIIGRYANPMVAQTDEDAKVIKDCIRLKYGPDA